MDLDKFLKSQTFKTGVFVLVVLFVFLLVFKLGILFGYKKALHPYNNGSSYHSGIWNKSSHRKGAFSKDMFGDYSLKKKMLKAKAEAEVNATSDAMVDNETGVIDSTE